MATINDNRIYKAMSESDADALFGKYAKTILDITAIAARADADKPGLRRRKPVKSRGCSARLTSINASSSATSPRIRSGFRTRANANTNSGPTGTTPCGRRSQSSTICSSISRSPTTGLSSLSRLIRS